MTDDDIARDRAIIEAAESYSRDFRIAARTRWPLALDELERCRARLAEQDATIARLTTERDEASEIVHDWRARTLKAEKERDKAKQDVAIQRINHQFDIDKIRNVALEALRIAEHLARDYVTDPSDRLDEIAELRAKVTP